MRIISGKYKGRRFDKKLPAGIRPTTDSTKETIFNILANQIDFQGKAVCDICAGSGSLGFEVLSRGAEFCSFVDKSSKALRFIQDIASVLGIDKSDYECVKSDAIKFLNKNENSDFVYQLFFVDPPYNLRIGNAIVNKIIESGMLADDGVIVAESNITDGLDLPDDYEVFSHKLFGTTQVHFIRRKQ